MNDRGYYANIIKYDPTSLEIQVIINNNKK